jgi:hypothetical protein
MVVFLSFGRVSELYAVFVCTRFVSFTSLFLAVFIAAGCGGGEKLTTAPAPSATQPVATQSAASAEPKPSASAAINETASPSPTQNPLLKQAGKQPGTTVAVPESMKRPMTKEEFDKAMKALPPEVRQRIMGLQQAPAPPKK